MYTFVVYFNHSKGNGAERINENNQNLKTKNDNKEDKSYVKVCMFSMRLYL